MKTDFKKLAVQLTSFVILMMIVTLLLDYLIPALKITIYWPVILLVMYLLTLGILYLLMNSLKSRMVRFVNTYLLVSFSKMMLFAVLMFVYAWLNPDDAVSFIITFLIYYLTLLVYEVVVLVRLKQPEK